MKSSKILGLAIASALGMVSANVMAAVELGASTTQTPTYYASEINFESVGTVFSPPGLYTDAPHFTMGYTVQESNKIFVRVELTGATIATKDWAIANDTSLKSSTALATNVTTKLVEGGTIGKSYAIYEVSAVAGGTGISSTDKFHLNMASGVGSTLGMTTVANDTVTALPSQLAFAGTSSVSARVRVYNSLTAAQVPDHATSVAVKDYSGVIFGFRPAVQMTTKTNLSTASVATEYKEMFADDTIGTTTRMAAVGTFKLYTPSQELASVTVLTKAGVRIEDLTDVLVTGAGTAGTTVTVKGDFSLAKTAAGAADLTKVQLRLSRFEALSDNTCTSTIAGTTMTDAESIATDYSSATFRLAGATLNGNYAVCYTVPGTVSIPESNYTIDLNAVAAPGYVSSKASKSLLGLGSIKRDGVVLRSGFVSKYGIGTSRFILANTTTKDVNITGVKLYGNAPGATVQPTLKLALPYVLKAGTRTAIEMADLVDLANMPIQNTMVEFHVGAQDNDVFGTYQLLLSGSTVQTVVPLKKPGNY